MLSQIGKEEFKKIIYLLNDGPIDSQIVLVGEGTIFCKILEYNNEKIMATCIGANREKTLSTVSIPRREIAGINQIMWSRSRGGVILSASRLEKELLVRARKLFLETNSVNTSKQKKHCVDLDLTKHLCHGSNLEHCCPIEINGLTVKRGTPLYCDWDYLSLIAGGINSLGLGISLLSLSTGWDSSLWSFYKKKLDKLNSFEEIEGLTEATISGYLKFTYRYKKEGKKRIVDHLNMEGESWIPAYIYTNRKHDDYNREKWYLVYFKETKLM